MLISTGKVASKPHLIIEKYSYGWYNSQHEYNIQVTETYLAFNMHALTNMHVFACYMDVTCTYMYMY